MVKLNLPIPRDLFGEPIPATRAARPARKVRKIGYADKPATGPKGQRCGNCIHAERVVHRAEFTHKCQLMTHVWDHTAATDIHLQAPACSKWVRKPYKPHAHRD